MENESKKSRKKNRLKDFDYSSNASYFLMICSDRRKEIFSKIVYDEIATVIKQFKGAVSKEVGTTVWQKDFTTILFVMMRITTQRHNTLTQTH